MSIIADFHIHSKYSRATSPQMEIASLSKWAKLKGITLMGTGDFTHPRWLIELKQKFTETGHGLYEYDGTIFILTAEVYNLFYRNEKAKHIHNLIFAPSFDAVDEINGKLSEFGNLDADGRPILHLDPEQMVKEVLNIEKNCLIVPAHIWTPHFSLFGSNSGFNSIEDCFRDQAKNIYALETGLSSDPGMNWRWSALDRFSLISNSDSHSPSRIGREANILDVDPDYNEIINALKDKKSGKFKSTVEFFPEEGKYHYDGHRLCAKRLAPSETKRLKGLCPACGKKVTVGVMHRVEELCDREEGFQLNGAPAFKHLIPLEEIISQAIGVGVNTVSVENEYRSLINRFETEFDILLNITEETLRAEVSPRIAEGILNTRKGNVKIYAGYDGEYGKVELFGEGSVAGKEKQLELF
ncbi:MAG: DNA helicase UvrD [Candidatus Omnitrophica bacterium]|nr:DNA helicase UvrD [Candidatus Omnitrophota bacterium]